MREDSSMASSLAITEKRPTGGRTGGIFFQLFDWNWMLSMKKKKKKKLFSSTKLLLPPASKKFGGDEKMPKAKLLLIADENAKIRDDINNGMRDPGLVARLMGLESMPVAHHEKPMKASSDSEFSSNRYETSQGKAEQRPQKLLKTGGFLERRPPVGSSSDAFQLDRRVRRQHHHKLASPVKSPRLLSGRSTARLMVAATKILEPGLQSRRNRAKCALTYMGSSQSIEEVQVSKDGCFTKRSRVSSIDSHVGPCRSFNNLNEDMGLGVSAEETPVIEYSNGENKMRLHQNRTSSLVGLAKVDVERSLVIPSGKNRTPSLGVQAKINAERRAHEIYKRKNCVRSDRQQDGASSFIREQNKLKQNQSPPLVKDKLVPGAEVCNRQTNRRDPNAFIGMNDFTAFSRDSMRSRSATELSSRDSMEMERNGLERKNMARKRRSNNSSQRENAGAVSFTFEKKRIERSDLINGRGKRLTSSRSINRSCLKSELKIFVEGDSASAIKGNNTVSFTFGSPMRNDCRSFTDEEMVGERRGICEPHRSASPPEKLISNEKIGSIAPPRGANLRGDALSALLEQKIEELNSLNQDELAAGNSLPGRSTASILEDLISAFTMVVPTSQMNGDSCSAGLNQQDNSCFGCTRLSDQTISHCEMGKDNNEEFQAEAEAGISPASDADQPSPISILEASFSNDSCFSGSPNGSSGCKPELQSRETCNLTQSLDFYTDLLDSASSFDIEKFDTEKIPHSISKNSRIYSIHSHKVCFSECKLSYSPEAKSNAELLLENISLSKSEGMDFFLSDTLEGITKDLDATEAKDGNQLRRFHFDCIIEYLDSKFIHFCKSGFKAWLNLPLLMRRERLAREVCEEIRGWNDLVGKVMDDIVAKDMRHSTGIWTEFVVEALETGAEIENDILQELVGEMVIDLCTC